MEGWIDARAPAAGWRLWGMSLVERQLREMARLGLCRATVLVGPDPAARELREDFARLYDLEVVFVSEGEPVGAAAGWLVLEGDAVYDERVLQHLVGAEGACAVVGEEAAALRLGPGDGPGTRGVAGLLEGGGLPRVPLESLGAYVAELRLTMPAFVRRIRQRDELREVDRLMYRRTFKGVIDAVARYGYFDLVRWLTRHASRTSLTPNFLTVLSVAGIWAAVPCFAAGLYGWGAAAAWAGVLLDSVDGKLARLRLHLSDAMGAFEHISAMPGLGLWFVAVGWDLNGGGWDGPYSGLTAAMVGAFIADKMLSGGFKKRHGRELFDYRPVDALFHLVACRRNICLVFISLGAAAGQVPAAFALMVGWMLATLAFHAARFAWVEVAGGAPAGDPQGEAGSERI